MQATVIYHWLLYASRWPDYADPESVYAESMNDALAYWKKRSMGIGQSDE